MEKKFELKNILKNLKSNPFFMNCNIPMDYTAGLPIIQFRNSKVCILIPYLKYKITGEVDKTLVYPVKYAVKIVLPGAQPAGYEDLSVNAVFSKIDFEKPIGYFRHESIKNFTKQEYKAKKEELYAMYDKIINALLNNARYTEADNDAFKTLLNIMIEPSLKPMYKALDEEFYKKYLA